MLTRQSPASPTEREKVRALPWIFTSEALNMFFAATTFGSSVFILYLSELGLPKGYIGFLLSLFPYCGLVALVLAPWIARVGTKRIFLTFYGLRKFVILCLLLTPWVLAAFGFRAAVIFVTAVILLFALCRAIAETGFYPWYQESIPNRIRGKVGAISNILCTIMGAVALGTASLLLRNGEGLGRYSILIALGAGVGILSVLARFPVPGGAPVREATNGTHLAELRSALRDTNFLRYLTAMSCGLLGTVTIAFLPLYMKEQIGITTAQVVRLDVATTVGGFLASYAWGWAADRWGGRRTVIVGILAMTFLPVCWMSLPHGSAASYPLALGAMTLWGAVSIGNTIGTSRLLLNSVIPREKSTTYSAIWYAWTGLVGGTGTLAAGGALDALRGVPPMLFGLPMNPFTPLFLACILFFGASALLYRTVAADTAH
ncbi:MAG: Major Facilitator Superfamily protein [bacterium ADurb.Bin429]|nr:MAG: Major Facilitator Superfamily protein [bacterium ADurb.Bin429]